MSKVFESVLVIGLGKVGLLVATLLHRNGFKVTGLDRNPGEQVFPCQQGDVSDHRTLHSAIESHDAVVTCLPYHLNLQVATSAHQLGRHYFDLTEDVPTTQEIREMADTAKAVMAPQCGLAPGFIAIVGADLAKRFDQLRSIELRVGALPQHPRGLLGYAFNWSPEGVVNEYLNPCEVILKGQPTEVPPMEALETIVIDGVPFEAFTTSGGLGSMCETFSGQVETLNYKTIRYPGHCRLMRFFFDELLMSRDRERAGKILVNAKPPVAEDMVVVHAAVEGIKAGQLFREEFVKRYFPIEIDGNSWRAIAWTTAASVSAVVELVATGGAPSKGFLKQEEIALKDFFATNTGKLFQPFTKNE